MNKRVIDLQQKQTDAGGDLNHYLEDFSSLRFGLRAVRLVAPSFLCRAHFVTGLRLTALLVAELEADPELSHLTARENVRDPLDHKRTGLRVIGRARSWQRHGSVSRAVQSDL